jgi:hypothetical protein
VNPIGPEPEHANLTMQERGRWIAFLSLEVKQSGPGRDSQMGLSGALKSAGEPGGWCGCNGHTRALDMCLSVVWLSPSA